jgi:hypothetical protein
MALDGQSRLIRSAGLAQEQLPKRWLSRIAAAATEAAKGLKPFYVADKKADVYEWWLERFAGADKADLSESEIRARAIEISDKAKKSHLEGLDAESAKKYIIDFCAKHGARLLVKKRDCEFVEFWSKRIQCERWWRGQLRRWVVQCYERGELALNLVGAKAGAWYCSDKAVKRRITQLANSEAMMRQTVIESADGVKLSLWDASQTTVANREIRRGELMTRIRGCEEWADAQGLVGLFTTNTVPSRFHAQRHNGGTNKKYDGSPPDLAQAWLNQVWAKCRAQLHREGIRIMGFRVAEPHHDGTPHWHMLLWCKPEQAARVDEVMRAHWLVEDEFGAGENRVKIKRMTKGNAAGYVAKYIAKNIDDYKIDKHYDDNAPDFALGMDMSGVKPSMRVEAWASAWRIRQFQAIGQPPVTVYRELRRVTKEAAAGGSDTFITAWLAVHRKGAKLASWSDYMDAQGGAMLGRKDYRLGTFHTVRETSGRYGLAAVPWAAGVRDRTQATDAGVIPTKRERWGGEGYSIGRTAPAWTRWNNCTRAKMANRKNLTPELDKSMVLKDRHVDNFVVDDQKAAHYDKFWAAIMPSCG